jgi:hypothetical protein
MASQKCGAFFDLLRVVHSPLSTVDGPQIWRHRNVRLFCWRLRYILSFLRSSASSLFSSESNSSPVCLVGEDIGPSIFSWGSVLCSVSLSGCDVLPSFLLSSSLFLSMILVYLILIKIVPHRSIGESGTDEMRRNEASESTRSTITLRSSTKSNISGKRETGWLHW